MKAIPEPNLSPQPTRGSGLWFCTARFRANIGRWWQQMGVQRFPKATTLLITADGGGSNGSRNRLWKVALQTLADNLGLQVQVEEER